MDESEKRIQITAIGGQALPVIQGILEFDCSVNYLLHSVDTQKVAERIKSFVNEDCRLTLLFDPNSFTLVQQQISKIVNEHQYAEFYVNVSGGTKIMSLALFDFFREHPNKKRLFHLDQNGTIYNLPGNKMDKLTKLISIQQYISYSGQKVKSLTRDEDIPDSYFMAKELGKKLYAKHITDFHVLLKKYGELNRKADTRGDFELVNPVTLSRISWQEEGERLELSIRKEKYSDVYEEQRFIGRDYIGIILETKWFELEVLEMLRQWPLVREMAWSVVMPYQKGNDKNEIDIVVNLGNKLLFVECKTQLYDIKDIDKVRSGAKTYGGLGAKAVLVTLFEPNERIVEKCDDTNLLHFHFTGKDKTVKRSHQLIEFLEKEISKSNTF